MRARRYSENALYQKNPQKMAKATLFQTNSTAPPKGDQAVSEEVRTRIQPKRSIALLADDAKTNMTRHP